jgi:RNA polymerase primary sigma factor
MLPVRYLNEKRLVADVIKGDPAAISRFVELVDTPIWTTVVALVGDGAPGTKAFDTIITALRADGFSRLLRYDGQSTLSTFLTWVSRDILAEELARSFSVEPNQAWRRFDRFFGKDIRQRIGKRFSRATTTEREDRYQQVCIALVERDYHRVRAFDGRGSFGGFILSTVVDNLLTDLGRQEVSRPRLPADIARMSPLHQAIFAACVWGGVALDARRIAEAVRGKIQPEPHREEVAAVLDELAGRVAAARGWLVKPDIPIDTPEGTAGTRASGGSRTPEDILLELEEEQEREAFLDAVNRESVFLPDADRLYVQLFLSDSLLPPRELAKLMGIPVDEVNLLQQRVKRWMKQIKLSLKKTTAASV